MKNAKSLGPDGTPMESYKWLREDTAARKDVAQHVVDISIYCLDHEIMPTESEQAQVFTLYKGFY